MIALFFSGFLAATLHVVSGPDHLAAVTPIALQRKQKVSRIGFFWGIGHLLGMLLISVLLLLFKEFVSVERISAYSEQLVAVVLIGVGLWAFYRLYPFTKKANHAKQPHLNAVPVKRQYNILTALSIGLLHGLAGIAHFLMMLPVMAFENRIESILYIVGFGLGTVAAMTLYTFILGKITKHNQNKGEIIRGIRFTGALFAILIGMYWFFKSTAHT